VRIIVKKLVVDSDQLVERAAVNQVRLRRQRPEVESRDAILL
jgi:hypothetical protein